MRESRTSSTSYSSSSPIRSGGGGGSFLWDSNAGGMYGFNRASLKTGCTFQDDGSLSSYEDSPFFGPLHLSSSFCVGRVDFRFSEVTHTKSPGLYGCNSDFFLSYCRFMTLAAFSRDFAASPRMSLIQSAKSCACGFLDFARGSIPFHGCCPYSRKNGEQPVDEFCLSLYENSASGTHSAQSS